MGLLLAGLGLAAALLMQIISMSVERVAILTLSLSVLGLFPFAVAKLTVIARGPITTFGSAQMTPAMRRLYRMGWALVLAGVIGMVLVLLSAGR